MKRLYKITILSTLAVMIIAYILYIGYFKNQEEKTVKVGVIYIGDAATAYTYNFIKAISALEHIYSDQVEVISKYNVQEGSEETALQNLVDEGCDIIFTTSYGYEGMTKQFAQNYPNIQFCQATGDNANTEPILSNYHTFMGEIYQGRYISGVVAGMKLKELLDTERITEPKVGYVGAYPYAEVISGYTAFFLGVRSIVPNATMDVIYTNTWSDFLIEKAAAKKLIENGCAIISQHSDTKGAAIACEDTTISTNVYHVGYNQNMLDIAPTTSLISCRINWEPYIVDAVGALLKNKKIENVVSGNKHGNDISAGFDREWVEMLTLNEVIATSGTSEKVAQLIQEFKNNTITVFKGDYIGIVPNNPDDVYDLHTPYIENENASAPSFHYVLKDVITILE